MTVATVYDAQIGKYMVRADEDIKHIFPRDKNGKSLRITLIKYTVTLRYMGSTTDVMFSRYKHVGRWYWRDSRMKQGTSKNHVIAEISRMLKMSRMDAKAFVETHLKG